MKITSTQLTILLLVFSAASNCFGQKQCGSTFSTDSLQYYTDEQYENYLKSEAHSYTYESEQIESGRIKNSNCIITIPVVVHIMHIKGEAIGTGLNITDAQVKSQIDVLNEDFRRLNADATKTPAVFRSIAIDPRFEFKLACVDPSGNTTTAINRYPVDKDKSTFWISYLPNGWIDEERLRVKFARLGGADAWPTDCYLNIWVCDIGGLYIGLGQFPHMYASTPKTDGVVIDTKTFGKTGDLMPQYNLGRTATHEVGHWLNLRHVGGDDDDACTGTDECEDTPNQGSANFNCPTFPHISCENGPNGDMFMNYMDYTDDNCYNLFTNNQKTRMRAVFAPGGVREPFLSNYFGISNTTLQINCDNTTITAKNPMCLPVTWSVTGDATIVSSSNSSVTIKQNTTQEVTVTATAACYIDTRSITLPDLSIAARVIPAITHGKRAVKMLCTIDELNGSATNPCKDITVYITKRADFTLQPYNPNLTRTDFGEDLQNEKWEYKGLSPNGGQFHMFKIKPGIILNANERNSFELGFVVENIIQDGPIDIYATITDGSGGETNAANNTDRETIEAFIN